MLKYWKNKGISSIGETKPDSKTAGVWKTKTPKIACCWVYDKEEINKPTPIIENIEINVDRAYKKIDPEKGILKNSETIKVIIIVEKNATKSGGIVFEINISSRFKGLTRSWLKVPSSRSRAIDNALKIIPKLKDKSTIKLTVKNHL